MPTKKEDRAKQVRIILAAEGIRYYELADALGVSYNTFNRWLRSGLTEGRYNRVMEALETMRKGGGAQ